MKLVIVESPTKAKTISKFLGKDFKIESSYGHVRDLPKGKLGVDVDNNFEPKYVTPRKNQKTVTALKKLSAKSDSVILATDEDREGEAIAWHLANALGLNENKDKAQRIVFHEITKTAIEKALENPRNINLDMVNAQQARRVLDRLVGYKLSPFLWKKVASGLSAGRVQSVALRLIVEREEEIRKFNPQEYWTIEAELEKDKRFIAELTKIDEKPIEKLEINSEESAKKISVELKNGEFKISNVIKKQLTRNPYPPFMTSTLQQEASKRLGLTAKKTMFIAQGLYEKGYITYMRTDSLNLSEESLLKAQTWIEKNIGVEYAKNSPRRFKSKSKLAQEAHEAIRP
ncbi:MAG TPA: type I DNA topoisomerase, partial [Candidatus Paceibacterota bacterium]